MFTTFEGVSADAVWRKMADTFRNMENTQLQGSRVGENKEILHASITIADPKQRWVVSREPAINPIFAIAEVVWIVNGRSDPAFLQAWNSEITEYYGNGPSTHGAYGYRLRSSLGIDQLKRAYDVLSNNPTSRQVVLQIWNSAIDLPLPSGKEVDKDIPCNVMSLLKVRNNRLEWLQVLRSNDIFLGVPYNFVQFTCLQEVIAGWLGIECGQYHQISDSLHLYKKHFPAIDSLPTGLPVPMNNDTLALPIDESAEVFQELGSRIERLTTPGIGADQMLKIAEWTNVPQAYRNMLFVMVAEAARKGRYPDVADEMINACSSEVYKLLWRRWKEEMNRRFMHRSQLNVSQHA